MKFPLRIASSITILVSTSVLCLGQAPAKETTASVPGRVTIGGKPAAGVRVVASFNASFFDNKTVAKTTTDEDGNYKLTGLAAGKFNIFPLANAYVIVSSGAAKGTKQSVNVAEGEAITKIDFPLARGGVITGRITDSEGHPLIGEQLSVVIKDSAKIDPGPQMMMLGTGRNLTDDRGVYRVYGLAPGTYTVSVGQSSAAGGAVSIMGMSGSRYLKTYFPGVTDEGRATAIDIKEGSEIKDINISVSKPDAGHSVSGRVVDAESGQPVPNAVIGHSAVTDANQQAGMNFTGNQSDVNGKFKLEGLRPGRYVVFTINNGVSKSSTYSEPAAFEIADADVSGIEIKVRRGATINGIAVIESNSDPAVVAQLQTFQVYAFVEQKESSAPSYSTSAIAADGSFNFTGLAPGRAYMGIQGFPAPPKGFTLVRTEYEGVPQPEGIELSAGAQLSGVRLVFAYGSGVVRGTVTITNGPLPDGTTLVMMLRSVSGQPRQFHRQSELDARLQFVIENVPPGDYEVVVRGVSPVIEGKPGPSVEYVKQTVNVANGSETKAALAVDAKKGAQP